MECRGWSHGGQFIEADIMEDRGWSYGGQRWVTSRTIYGGWSYHMEESLPEVGHLTGNSLCLPWWEVHWGTFWQKSILGRTNWNRTTRQRWIWNEDGLLFRFIKMFSERCSRRRRQEDKKKKKKTMFWQCRLLHKNISFRGERRGGNWR